MAKQADPERPVSPPADAAHKASESEAQTHNWQGDGRSRISIADIVGTPEQLADWRLVNSILYGSKPEQLGFGNLILLDEPNKPASDQSGQAGEGDRVGRPEASKPAENYREIAGDGLVNGVSYDLVPGQDVALQRNKLVDGLEKGLSNNQFELTRAKIFIGGFEERMQVMEKAYMKQGLDQQQAHKKVHDEVLETYRQINRILDKSEPSAAAIGDNERVMLAKQILSSACNTGDIGQGGHKTCNVAAVEVRTYTQDPASAARLVADVVMTGKYTTRDGHEIKIDKGSIVPHDEAKSDPPISGGRSYASQIFQVAAVNIYHQRNGNLRYEQREPSGESGDTGERLVDYSVNPPKDGPSLYDRVMGKDSEYFYTRPLLGGKEIIDIGNQISDNNGKDWFFAEKNYSVDGVPKVSSQEELLAQLANAVRNGQLPIVLRVNTNNEPFFTDSGAGAAGGSGGWHVVTVMDFVDGSPPRVMVDNQWDRSSDHTNRDYGVPLPVLFKAMQEPEVKDKSS